MVAGTGSLYPLFAPIVGALGAFLTGSGTNSNVLFGPLQIAAAQGLNPVGYEDLGFWLAAVNSGAAGIGKNVVPTIHRNFHWCRRSCFESIPRKPQRS